MLKSTEPTNVLLSSKQGMVYYLQSLDEKFK